MFTIPLPNNQNMNSRNVDPSCESGGTQNPSEATSGHGFINMVRYTKFVTNAKYYGSSQPDLGKEHDPPESSLQIENSNNDEKNMNNARGDKQPKCKVNFPCKLCKDDHLTHLCHRMEDASKFIAQGPAVFTNPFPNNQNMNSRIIDSSCASGRNQNPPEATSGYNCINMVHAAKVVTRVKYYGSSQPDLGKEPNRPKSSL